MKSKLLAFALLCVSAVAQVNNARMLSGVNYQSGTSYTFQSIDVTRVTVFSNASSVSVSLSSGLANPFFGAGSVLAAFNRGAGTVTITCTGCTINGGATLSLVTNQAADIYGDGQNYVALMTGTGGGGGTPSLPFGSLQGNNGGSFGGIPNTSVNFITGAIAVQNPLTVNQLAYPTGLGASTHILGPSDQPLVIGTQSNQNAVVTPNGTGLFGISYLTQCRPITVGANGLLNFGSLYWDAASCPGATPDAQLNAANGYALTTAITTIDARGLGGSQTLTGQVNVGEFLQPTISASASGGSLASGTYRAVYTLVSPTLAETEASEEVSVSVTGPSGSLSITLPSAAYLGTATAWNVYVTAANGNPWTETKCQASIPIGTTSVTITSVGSCSGTVSKSNTGVQMILPTQGIWTFTIPSSTACQNNTSGNACWGLKWFDHASIEGHHAGWGMPFYITTSNSNLAFICGSDMNYKFVGMYVRLDGFACKDLGGFLPVGATDWGFNHSSGTSVPGAIFAQASTFDQAYFGNLEIYNSGGAGANGLISALFYGTCCGTTLYEVHADGGGSNGVNGGIPLQFGIPSGPVMNATNVISGSWVHPGGGNSACTALGLTGNGCPNFLWKVSGNGVVFSGTQYMEGNLGSGCNTTTPLADIGATGIGGPTDLGNWLVGAICSGSTAPILQLESGLQQPYRVGEVAGGSSQTAINDLVLGVSSAHKVIQWPYPGMPMAVAKLPTCGGFTGSNPYTEGWRFVANNCNAGCSAGGTCTAGGTTHCEVACNHSNAWAETGVTF